MKRKNFVKKVVVWMLSIAILCSYMLIGAPKEVQAASASDKAKNAYAAFLKKPVYWGSSYINPSDIKFGLIDINNDKVPELYLKTEKWDYDYDYKLYGYVNGKVKCLYSFRRSSELQKVYPATGTIYVYGSYNKGRIEKSYYQFNGKQITNKASRVYSSYLGFDNCYIENSIGNYTYISKSKYNSIVKKLTSGSAKSSPKLYSNTASNRTKYLGTSESMNKVYFEKGTWYAFSNGGFYLKISKISGNKFTFSIYMPYGSCSGKTAIVGSSGKTATAKITCKEGDTHNLTFKVIKNGVSVTEKSSCYKMLLAADSYDNYSSTLTHEFFLENYYSDY